MPNQPKKIKKKPTAVSVIIENLFSKDQAHFSEIYFLFQLSKSWKQIAGEEISQKSKPIKFKNKILFLSLPDSTHLQEMHFAKTALQEKINKIFPDKKIKKIVLKTGTHRFLDDFLDKSSK